MHTGEKPASAVNYLSASTASTGLYLTPKTDYPIINDVSNGSFYQGAAGQYYNQATAFGSATANCTTNSYDQAAINRRKNATRETTNTLKAWLYEHRKNPYPTKGEKIMLAIITKMTLTQVSTWFANARRRLKKENKMTWEPRNKCNSGSGDEEDSSSDGEYAVSGEKENGEMITSVETSEELPKSADSDAAVAADRLPLQTTNGRSAANNKCDDSSDSNSTKRNTTTTSPLATFENDYGKGENYSAAIEPSVYLENGSSHRLENERFFPYSAPPSRTTAAAQFCYAANRAGGPHQQHSPPQSHHPQYSHSHPHHHHHIAYSTAIQMPSAAMAPSLTYAQSPMNEVVGSSSIYNQIHYNSSLNASCLQQPTASVVNLPTASGQPANQHPIHYNSSLSLNAAHHAAAAASYYAAANTDYAYHQQLAPNTPLYAPYPHHHSTGTPPSLTQLSSQVQSLNGGLGSNSSAVPLYPPPSTTVNSLLDKSDENNNLSTASETHTTSRKIWSLAQTAATDSANHSTPALNGTETIVSPNAPADTAAAAFIIDPSTATSTVLAVEQQQQQQSQTANGSQAVGKGHISSYIGDHSPSLDAVVCSSSSSSVNNQQNGGNCNQLTSYNARLPSYPPIDCGLAHNSTTNNTLLGKVFFDYISNAAAGPLEHERSNWTRSIGLL